MTAPLGTLHLLPTTLGPMDASKADPAALSMVLPLGVQVRIRQLDCFVAENAKTARAFLRAVGIARAIQTIEIRELNVHTAEKNIPALLEPLKAGRDVGLLSEAGCPAIADPGALLVRQAHLHQIRVCPHVGPSSLLLALMASGLDGQRFAFYGYLPTDAAERAQRLKALENLSRQERQTQVFIETPYRNPQLLEAMASTLAPSTLLCVATDITLSSEHIRTMAAPQWKGQGPSVHKRPTVFAFLAR